SSGSFAIKSSNTIGSIASISATSLTTGSVFSIRVATTSATTATIFKIFNTNSNSYNNLVASLSYKGNWEIAGYSSVSSEFIKNHLNIGVGTPNNNPFYLLDTNLGSASSGSFAIRS